MSNPEMTSKLVEEIAEIERSLDILPAKERKAAKDRIEVKRRMLRCQKTDTNVGSK